MWFFNPRNMCAIIAGLHSCRQWSTTGDSSPQAGSGASLILSWHEQHFVFLWGSHERPYYSSQGSSYPICFPWNLLPQQRLHLAFWQWRPVGVVVGVFCDFPGRRQSTIHTGEDFPYSNSLHFGDHWSISTKGTILPSWWFPSYATPWPPARQPSQLFRNKV